MAQDKSLKKDHTPNVVTILVLDVGFNLLVPSASSIMVVAQVHHSALQLESYLKVSQIPASLKWSDKENKIKATMPLPSTSLVGGKDKRSWSRLKFL